MKYWYDENTLDDAIRFYRKMDDEIMVFYFNGNILGIKYNEDVEKELLNDMLVQAEVRNKNISVDDLKAICAKSDMKLFTILSFGYFCGVFSNTQNVDGITEFALGLSAIISGMCAFFEERRNSNIGKQIEELEKYKLYLSIRKEIEDNFNHETFKGIKCFNGNFNINTLDDYSLGEVKKIKHNLQKNK